MNTLDSNQNYVPEREHLAQLRRLLASRFSEDELRTLCFDLGVDYDDLSPGGKAGKARELVAYLERQNRIFDLIRVGRVLRRDISWNDILKRVTQKNISEVKTSETIFVPAGPFWIGSLLDDSEAYENEKPQRELGLQGYQIGVYPVTNTQYADFVWADGYSAPKHWDQKRVPTGLEDHPVVNVSFEDAEAYCRWLSQISGKSCRLPTEEEWEKAARGGMPETRRYVWGDLWQSDRCNTKELGRNSTTLVYEFEWTTRSLFGGVDMAGNVWEWTASWYERYPDCPHESLQYGRVYRVVRGGAWSNSRREARISCRGRYKPDVQRPYLGFRIAVG